MFVMNVFSRHTLTCQPAEYRIGKNCCLMCPAGSRVVEDCRQFRNTSCLSCWKGTYMNQPTARRLCFSCKDCVAGSGLKIKTSCTAESDTVCEPLEGFYCVKPSDNDCDAAMRHTSCEPGQYISKNGSASSDAKCSECSNGTFSDGSFTSCRPHIRCGTENHKLVKAGTASTDAHCEQHQSHLPFILKDVFIILFLLILYGLIFWKVKCSQYKPGQEQAILQNTTNEAQEESTL